MMRALTATVLLGCLAMPLTLAQEGAPPAPEVPAPPADSRYNVVAYGAPSDASADATPAFQEAIDAAHRAGGGTVFAPRGRYRFDGALTVKREVTLEGIGRYAPAHAGLRDQGQNKPEFGTVFEVVGGAGEPDGPAFITLLGNAALRGVTVYYPEQDPQSAEPTPYPYAVALRENNPALLDTQLLNPYLGIDATQNQRALIRNVHGQPIYKGVVVDAVYDIGRIENVHWNPWWSMGTPVYEWQVANGIGFEFGRTDWHYVHNTFCFGYNVGYKFIETGNGVTNGNFLGIGADDCWTAIAFEQTARVGVLITNGEFVSFRGPDPTMVRVGPRHRGSVRFVNCAFWGPCNRIAVIDGRGTVGFSDCTFMQWGHGEDGDAPAVDVLDGTVLLRGNEFQERKPQVRLGPDVDRAIISENVYNGAWQVTNEAEGNVLIKDNLGDGDD